jgi:hypothetical protein
MFPRSPGVQFSVKLERETVQVVSEPDTEPLMSLCADIVAWGPYSPDIADHLEYTPDVYRSTKSGALVLTELFGIVEGSAASKRFASLCGISDVWDFNQHKIDPERIDAAGLRSLFKELDEGETYMKQLDSLLALRSHGFQFIFRPNG